MNTLEMSTYSEPDFSLMSEFIEPTMSEEELKGKIILFKQILEKCLLSFETDYDEIVSGVIDSKGTLKTESSVQKVSESEQSSQSVQSTQSEKSETQETKPRKIEIINIK